MTYLKISNDLKKFALGAENSSKFFKSKPGFYAEHDVFLGIPVPYLRRLAKDNLSLSFNVLREFLYSKINEERLFSLIILVEQYNRSKNEERDKIYQFYLKNIKQVNNWNLVDASAHLIVGKHLFDKKKDLLINLANSKNLWERRIAIVSTWYFIRNNELDWTAKISQILLNDTHDLIHKATGWMLREMGKKDIDALKIFLKDNASIMPRTMLRYAIEKFSFNERQNYLKI